MADALYSFFLSFLGNSQSEFLAILLGKIARNQRTKQRTDTRISFPVSGDKQFSMKRVE